MCLVAIGEMIVFVEIRRWEVDSCSFSLVGRFGTVAVLLI